MNRPPERPTRWIDRLSWRLSSVLLLVVGLLAAWLAFVVAPATAEALSTFSRQMRAESRDTMHDVSEQLTKESSTLLVDLIRHTTSARARALRDLPLELFGGGADDDAIRAAVLREDAERSARQLRNVEVLAAEMRRRADRDIGERIERFADVRARREADFVADLRRTHLWLVTAMLLALLLVLGFGLHRMVVRPAHRLRRATQRIASGELGAELPPAGRGELGELTHDFAAMIAQLRSSRAELQRSADNLEAEVRRKTRDLASTHQQLAEAERLAALGTLAGGVAHEFHNVIGGIRGCARELLADERDEDRRETLAVITRAADRGAGIVDQLQRFARRPSRSREQVDVGDVVRDALELCAPAARGQGVAVARELGEGCAVMGDGDALHQVFVNLLVNALQVLPDGGELRVEVAGDDRCVRVTVQDSGPGIAEHVLPHVFEPFFTTDRDGVEGARRGSGLGLAVSYGIVTEHGGSIVALSPPGAGATFVVELPRA